PTTRGGDQNCLVYLPPNFKLGPRVSRVVGAFSSQLFHQTRQLVRYLEVLLTIGGDYFAEYPETPRHLPRRLFVRGGRENYSATPAVLLQQKLEETLAAWKIVHRQISLFCQSSFEVSLPFAEPEWQQPGATEMGAQKNDYPFMQRIRA